MKQILKYWKQLLGVVIVLAVSFIGMGSIMAASVGISIMSADTPDNQVNLTSWEVGHMEYFAASVTGVDDLNPDEGFFLWMENGKTHGIWNQER